MFCVCVCFVYRCMCKRNVLNLCVSVYVGEREKDGVCVRACVFSNDSISPSSSSPHLLSADCTAGTRL